MIASLSGRRALFDRFWEARVDERPAPDARSQALHEIARRRYQLDSADAVSAEDLSQFAAGALEPLRHDGVLRAENDRYRFVHDLVFDFTLARTFDADRVATVAQLADRRDYRAILLARDLDLGAR